MDDNGEQPGTEYEGAAEILRRVSVWYSQAIMAERRAPAPDSQRLEHLMAKRQECVEDSQALKTATPEQVEQLAQRYAAHWKELTEP
ncbi:hypothetical protein [Streptomyces olivaceiscleroticus]|uniref:Uncharacterized protein n=1 Tax=Streptomyces olivaceiscleroticus TaxID=68245 RepID=A0ABN0ZPL6_9ACTN